MLVFSKYKRYATVEEAIRAARPDQYVVSVLFPYYILTARPNDLRLPRDDRETTFLIVKRPKSKEPVSPSPDITGLQFVGPFPHKSKKSRSGRPTVQGGGIESNRSRH
jgi:hypothetical protein